MSQIKKLSTARLLFRSAETMGLQPHWLVENGLFAVRTDAGERYITTAKSTLNSHAAVSLVLNKFHTRMVLQRHNLPNIPFARPKNLQQAVSFLRTHHKIIVKPVCGSNSQNIHIVTNPAQFAGMDISRTIFEQYISGTEMRYLVLNGQVIAVHQSEYGGSVAEDRDLQRISFEATTWDPILMALSLQITDIFHLKFAAVDFLINPEGRIYILEINSTPGLKWLHAPTSGPSVDVASRFLQAMLEG